MNPVENPGSSVPSAALFLEGKKNLLRLQKAFTPSSTAFASASVKGMSC